MLCQGFLLASLRLIPGGTEFEIFGKDSRWKKVVAQDDLDAIKSGLETMRVDASSLGKADLSLAQKQGTYWSAVCNETDVPACSENPCHDQNCDIGKWLLAEFGPLQKENTRQLLHHIRLSAFPPLVIVANAGVELACLHQVIPVMQDQEGR